MALRALELDIGVITYSDVGKDDGFTTAQVGLLGVNPSGSGGEVHYPYGFFGRPPDPVVDDNQEVVPAESPQCLYAWYGNQLHIWPLEDPRAVAKQPALKKGEAYMHGGGNNFVRMHANGSISLSTTNDGTVDGDSIFFRILSEPGDGDQDGPAFLFGAPWGYIRFDATGFHVRCASGARFDLGAMSGFPAPMDALETYATLKAHMVALEGVGVSIGPDTGASQPIANALPVIAYLQALTTWAAAVSDAIATFIPAGGASFSPTGLAEVAAAAPAASLPPIPALIAASTSVT